MCRPTWNRVNILINRQSVHAGVYKPELTYSSRPTEFPGIAVIVFVMLIVPVLVLVLVLLLMLASHTLVWVLVLALVLALVVA
jgi:hypothetical protein